MRVPTSDVTRRDPSMSRTFNGLQLLAATGGSLGRALPGPDPLSFTNLSGWDLHGAVRTLTP